MIAFVRLVVGLLCFAAFLPERLLLPGTIQRNVVYVLFNKKRMRRLVLLFAPSHRQVGWLMGVSCFVLWKLLSLSSLASPRFVDAAKMCDLNSLLWCDPSGQL